MAESFEDLGLDPCLVKALEIEKIIIPTDIQSRVIPEIILNKDVIMRSETGTGKTLAYLLPLFEKIKNTSKEMKAVILAPTHELVIQIQRQMEKLSQNSGFSIRSTPIIGGTNITRQIDKLKGKPQIIVGSPGRILELIQKNKIKAQTIQMIILDEADRLLDMHNVEPVLKIIKSLQKERQLIIASATLPQKTIDMAKSFMADPVLLTSEGGESIPESISHCCLITEQRDKIELLTKLIKNLDPVKALVFLNNVDQIDNLTGKLQFHGIKIESLHGTDYKMDRKRVMDDYRTGRLRILIASDIAARGLQMDGITYIFNIDIPEGSKDYLHRAGRTGRNGLKGIVVSLATVYEMPLLRKIEKELKIKIENKILFKGKITEDTESRGIRSV
ncbi:MAG: DEAD/DEAH box helicase [bacterium]|nr:DEAD/DEAH box helicase [bacterium]